MGTRNFTAPDNTVLDPNTKYLLNFIATGDHLTDLKLDGITSDAQTGIDADWAIEDAYRIGGTLQVGGVSAKIGINGAARSNAATGKPGITGAPQRGRTLTATLGSIQDANGLMNQTFPGDYTFQWAKDGTDITGATDDTYDVPATETLGSTFTVKVSFSDDDGNAEGPLESDPTPGVIDVAEDCATNRADSDWCATMTVGAVSFVTIDYYGYNEGNFGGLDDRTIDYGGTTYTVDAVAFADGDEDEFWVFLDAFVPQGSVFNLGRTELTADASVEQSTTGQYIWDTTTTPGWLDDQKVTVSANLAPVVTGAEVDAEELKLTFAEDLDDNSTPAASAFTVYIDGSTTGENPDSVDDIDGNTVTMTLATDVAISQTVTLDYEAPSTSPLQDESELKAPSFTGQAVTNNTGAGNNAPTASDNTVTTNEDTDYTFAAADFGFMDDDGDSLTDVKVTSLPGAGKLILFNSEITSSDLPESISKNELDDGSLKFTPAANANGSAYATFQFKVNDGTVDSDQAYTMTIDVTPVNDPPTASANDVTTNEDTAYTFTASDFNFADVDGDALASVKIIQLETAGDLELDGTDVTVNQVITKADIDDGKLKFAAGANEHNSTGFASIIFKVNDGTADSLVGYSLTINVLPVNDLPTASDNTVTTNEDTAYTFMATDFNFSDVDGDTLASVKIVQLETAGDLELDGTDVTINEVITKADIDDGKLKFTPGRMNTIRPVMQRSGSESTTARRTARHSTPCSSMWNRSTMRRRSRT